MRKILVVLLALAMLPVLSFAQVRGGDIYGSVVLADGSKVPGVLITLTGDKIGTLTTISSDKGNFRFLALPPGGYELKCELEGFKTVIRKDIEIALGRSVTLNILMETTTLKEEITVSGRVGVIDTRKTQVGVNVNKEFVEQIPTSRNPWTVLSALPGVMVDRVDVGGADSGQQSNFMAGGGDQDDTTWNVDGANITDPSAIGAAPAYLNINTYQELQVTLGANDITAQTGGIQLNFVTKRAGNRTSGDFHLYVEDENWEMSQDPTEFMAERGLVVPGVERLYQYGINMGGPIVKDKLWWFGSWAIQDIHKRTEADIEDATWLVSGYGKLNFQLGNTSGDFHISYDAKLKWGRTWMSAAQQDNWSLWDQTGPGFLYYGGLSHVFGELMLNVKTVYTDGGFALDPRGSDIDPDTGHSEGRDFKIVDGWSSTEGSAWDYATNRNSIDIAADGNYFLEGALGGDHEIRFGVDYFTADTTTHSLTPNQRILYIYRYNPAWNFMAVIPDYVLDVNFKRISAFIQDTITWGKLTASIGVRYDKEQGGVNSLTQPGHTWYEPGTPHHGTVLFSEIQPLSIAATDVPVDWSLISPRVSFTYDITGDGKNVVKVSAGRYMSQSGNLMASTYIPYRWAYVYWTDANMDETPQYSEVGDYWLDYGLYQYNLATGLNNVEFDPDYNTPYLDELTLMFEKALTDDMAISLTGFYKKKHNLSSDVNSRGEISSVTKGILPGGSIEDKSNWEYTGTTTVGGTEVPTYERIVDPIGDYYYNLEQAYDRYLGLQLLLTKKLSNKWMANLSFTLQDWKRFRFEDEYLDLNNFDFFNEGVVAPATTGSGLRDIWVNARWMVKFTGLYQLPYGINVTAFLQAQEGNPQPLRRRVTLSQGGTYLYRTGYKAGDERLPTFWMLNLGLEKTLKVTDTVTATLVLDWYNATNNQIELKHNLAIGADAPGEVQPTMWTNAGLFQFGVRLNF
ncbi:MAG: TonB-dependent receptor [Candidatus Aminicenantes bacterium]|nr:MAG: TonB-dependent receptor [Candidatus Aminicenantes bacterium]